MAISSSLHLLLVILLVFSQIIVLNAVPITRTRNLGVDTQNQGLAIHDQEISEENWGEDMFIHGRMDLESNDYPGSGANNRHTPRPPTMGRG